MSIPKRHGQLRYALLTVYLLAGPVVAVNGQNDSSHDHATHMAMVAQPMQPNIHDVDVQFELTSTDGSRVRPEDFAGSFLLLGFGFTHCDYVCPTMSANIASVLNASKEPVKGVLVSVDTERDTPRVTHEYAQSFHEDFIGLSGSYSQVAQAAKNFRVSFAVTKTQRHFTVQHTASIFLVDPEGNLRGVFALNSTTEDILNSMQAWNPS